MVRCAHPSNTARVTIASRGMEVIEPDEFGSKTTAARIVQLPLDEASACERARPPPLHGLFCVGNPREMAPSKHRARNGCATETQMDFFSAATGKTLTLH